MDKFELQRLRDLPIEGVAERLGLHVVRHKSLCPFHADKHPSMVFQTGKNRCRCFVCMNEAMGTISLAMRYLNLDFMHACQWLANENNVILAEYKPREPEPAHVVSFDASRYERFFLRPWLSEEARRFLYEERRLDPRVVSWCRLTSWRDKQGVNWLQIPYYDVEGRLVGVQNRNLTLTLPRFRFPYGSSCSMYNLPILRYLKPGDECWIAEGCSDAWSHMSDQHKVISIPSATLLQPHDKELLRDVTTRLKIRWKMMPDNDEPGRRLAAQLQEILPMLEIVVLPAGVKDYSDYRLLRLSQNSNDVMPNVKP